jgi:cytochrome P450
MNDAARERHGPAEPFDPRRNLLNWLQDNAPLFGSKIFVINDPALCEQVLRHNWRNYNRDGQIVRRMSMVLGRGLVGSNGNLWVSQRRMIQPLFAKSAIAGFFPVIIAANAILLQRWQQAARHQQTVNVTRDVSAMTLEITLRAIFGEDYPEIAEHFIILVDDSARDLAFAQKFNALRGIVLDVAARRRLSGSAGEDLLGGLMAARDRERGEPMADPQLASEVMTLIVGGHETTACLLNWMWHLLASHLPVQERVFEELGRVTVASLSGSEVLKQYPYTQQVIEESLRLYPSVWLMNRKAIADDEIGGHFIPAGTEIYISPYLLQRSPDLWQDPDAFDPERMGHDKAALRHPLCHCPFGAGPRNCIGEPLARAEIQINLMTIMRELRLLPFGRPSADIDAAVHLKCKDELVLQPISRHPRDAAANVTSPEWG